MDASLRPDETIVVDERVVGCDGGGRLGHPLVYLHMGDENAVICPYCSRRFVLREGASPAAGH